MSYKIGQSVLKKNINAFVYGEGSSCIHFYGGVHGDEPEGVDLAWQLKKYLDKNISNYPHQKIIVVPNCNPDGFEKNQRVNARGIDLNRNFPTQDWTPRHTELKYNPGKTSGSEPEVQALIHLMESHPPKTIVSFHSLIPHQINYDGPARQLAHEMAKKNGYPVTDHIGYPTPGSLGSYAGRERKIAVITFELPEKILPEKAWKDALEAIDVAIFA